MRQSFSILFLTLFFASSFQLFAQNSIQKVDPPNWWIGMKYNQVQLLVYGENMGDLKASIDYEGVDLEQSITVANNNYLFLNVKISESAQAGEVKINFSKNGKVQETYAWPLLARSGNPIQGFDNSDAIYLITPDRFANGNPSNDEVEGMREKLDRSNKGGRHGGDLEGIRQNLDYIKDMGFTAVWLNPVLENDMKVYSYHGYSTTDFYQVDKRYGSNADYQAFAKETHQKGLSPYHGYDCQSLWFISLVDE